ncbi:prepilin-type N-terminal cleavage/methylation domain-containing protein [Chitinibacter sp. S2-10]|uniref:prepilin-type N-terminal cleavage/methylation domain-containing protein n=1 Tax=Chitinibacter sp. S2-10 TaxID=3373597 RepID=UPI00397728B6
MSQFDQNCGFTLVEMAIVLLVIGLLLGAGLNAVGAQMASQRYRESKTMLERANQALLGFALVNHHLPCPADPVLDHDQPLAGMEDRQAAGGANAYRCERSYGDLPWRELGLPELDAWGRRLKYAVKTDPSGGIATYAGDFAGANPTLVTACGLPSLSPCFSLLSGSNLTVRSASRRDGVASNSRVLVSNAVAIVFSEGPQGGSSGNDETENRDADNNYIADAPDGEFDDLLVWLPLTQLFYQLGSTGQLP